MLSPNNILFNPFKHHAGFIREFISLVDSTALLEKLKTVGHCQLDLYFGELKIESIYQEILDHVKAGEVSDIDQYKNLIFSHGGYYTMTLSDRSKWVLRLGRDEQSFMHIHPARNSVFVMRVVANALKSVLAFGVLMRSGDIAGLELMSFNAVRTSILNLSPVKNIEEMKAVERTMKIIFNKFSGRNINYESLASK